MAIKSKYRIKNSRGIYDIMHFETSADQVQETAEKVFVSPAEKSTWNNKSDLNHNHDTVYLKKYKSDIGDGSNSTITVKHNLNTEDITITIRDASTKEIIYVDTQIIDANSIKLLFHSAPTISQYKIVITG